MGLLLPGLRAGARPTSEWSARTWQVDDGLPDNRITGLAQTSAGELWVATPGGLARFDGVDFEVFRLDQIPGVWGHGLLALYADSRDRFWVGAIRDVVVCVDRESTAIYGREEGIPGGELSAMAESGDGTVWLAIGNRVGRIDGGRFHEVSLPGGSGKSLRAALCRDATGQVWCFVNGQLGLLQLGRFVPKAQLPHREVALGRARSGGVWVAGDAKAYRCDESGLHAVAAGLAAGVKPRCLLEASDGALWIGTRASGLFRCAASRAESIETAAPEIGQLLEDRDGNIWAGTEAGGLHRLQLSTLELLGAFVGLPQAAMRSVCQDSTGIHWAVASDGRLLRSSGGHWTEAALGPLESGASATCVTASPHRTLWVGTQQRGLFEVDLSTGAIRHWTKQEGLPGNYVVGLYPARDGSVWFSVRGSNGFGNLSRGQLRLCKVPASVRIIRAIVEDAQGTIWAGTSDGQVLKVADDLLVQEPALAHFGATSVRTLMATPDGSLWIGFAARGLGLYRSGSYSAITTAQGLAEDGVWQMAADHHGSIWLAGLRGWYRLPVSELHKVADDPHARVRPALFRNARGQPVAQAHYNNTPAVSVGMDGDMLFATNLGLMALHPKLSAESRVPATVLIDRVTLDDRIVAWRGSRFPLRPVIEPRPVDTLDVTARLWLPPDHQRLTFDFAALDYSAAENVHYRYRLENAEEAWTETTNASMAHYSRLPAGDYRFHVIASNAAGFWHETGTTLAVTVGAFYWQTWWFKLGAIAGFTGLVAAAVRFVSVRRLQARLRTVEQQRALLQERTRIARDIHDDLGGSLTHIKLLSELAVREGGLQAEVEASVRQITRVTQTVLKSVDGIVWAVNPRNDTLPNLISYVGQHTVEFLRAAGIGCVMDLPENPPEVAVRSEVRHHLFLALKEALANIARHSGARNVRVCVEVGPSGLIVGVQDDGCSFATAPDDALADGLRNMRQRLESIGGRFRIEARLGLGTNLTFEVPLDQSTG